ncbi:hypothetical protein LCGC14_3002560 [marine sediment metagenome]|uniref:Uncharacterized protein n=1 Tax=marine sediment metagenome TaxID=412755 RepID=A0A0F8XN67_9ZZZZ
MIVNKDNKSVDIETRDWNYIMPAYVRSYMFYLQNESPEKIVFPMFRTVRHPVTGDDIPVEWVPEDSPIAIIIMEEGGIVKEATETEIALADEKDDEIANLRKQIADLEVVATPTPEDLLRQQEEDAISSEPEPEFSSVPEDEVTEGLTKEEQNYEAARADQHESPARAAFKDVPDREPKQPDTVIPPGSQLDGMGKRDKGDQRRVARDLQVEADIDESKEKLFDKTLERDAEGKPVVKSEE